MQNRLLAIAAFALIFMLQPAMTLAQDWGTDLDATLQIEDPQAQKEKLSALLERAGTPQDKIVAHYYLANATTALGHNGESVMNLEKAIALTDEHYPDNIGQRDTLVNVLIQAYQATNRREDVQILINSNVARKDELVSDIWSKTDYAMVHRMSGLLCPHAFESMVRGKTSNFSSVGIDVGCNYEVLSEHRNDITVYLTKSPGSERSSHDQATRAVIENWGKDAIVYEAQNAGFSTAVTPNVLDTLFKSESGLYTQAHTARIGEWVLKTRITWREELGQNFGSLKSKALFETAPKNVPAHLNTCETLLATRKQTASRQPASIAGLFGYAAGAPDKARDARSETECFFKGSENEDWFVSAQDNSARKYTIDGDAIDGDIYVSATGLNIEGLDRLEKDNPGYELKRVIYPKSDKNTPEDEKIKVKVEIIASYDALPSAQQVFEDFKTYQDGRLITAGSIEIKKNGGTNISINPAAMEK